MTKEIPTIRSVLFSVIPLILVYYAGVWIVEQFMSVLEEMLVDGVLWATEIIFRPYFPLVVLCWAAAVLGLAVAFPTKRRIFWHVALWSGLMSVVFFFIGLFMPMISVISSLSAGE